MLGEAADVRSHKEINRLHRDFPRRCILNSTTAPESAPAWDCAGDTGRRESACLWETVGLLTDDDLCEVRAAAYEVLCFLGCEKSDSEAIEK